MQLVANPLHWPKHLEVPIQLFVGTVPCSTSTPSHHLSLNKLNSKTSTLENKNHSRNGTPPCASSVNVPGTPRNATLKSSRLSLTSMGSYKEGGLRAKDIVSALQQVRRHARAESLGNPTYENISGRRNSGMSIINCSNVSSRRGTMSSQGGTLTRKPPKAPVTKRRSDPEYHKKAEHTM